MGSDHAGNDRGGILRAFADRLFPPVFPPAGGGGGAAARPHGLVPPLLVVLTFVSGLVDAVSYLGLDHVFVANMTGNVALLGFALAGDRELSGAASVLALAAFLLGAWAAGRLRRSGAGGGKGLFGPLVAVQAVLVAGAFAVSVTGGGQLLLVGLLALGMGLQNAVVHRLSVPDLTTTVVTRTLTGLAVDPWGPASVRRVVSVVALLCGALCGGLLTLNHGSRWALLAALVLLAWVAALGLRGAGPGPEPGPGPAGP
ncbi:YoaK family protein [Streptomyces sp. H27-H5]|uniref:YoaK family protein n=1 Tax=Streptomyces sp. H27-H5 TaxID=2996460 RepID=UPI00226D717A|nr:YoaK family protein [Streptomyces sp. H27-H5]MCY0960336.1 YoaK family protein [Streptomyces sp. H27-H5]